MLSRRANQTGVKIAKTGRDAVATATDRVPQSVPMSDDDAIEAIPENGVDLASIAIPSDDRPGDADQMALWLRRADQLLLGFLLIALLVLLIAFRWKLSGGTGGEIEISSQQPREYFYAIDINKASWVEWAQLDGIGEKIARRIVKDRDDNGPFDSIDALRRVRGLGPKTIEKLRPFLKSETDQAESSSESTDTLTERVTE